MAEGSVDYYSPDAQLADSLDRLDSVISNLDDVITELNTSIDRLIEIAEATASRRRTDYAVITTTPKKIIDVQALNVGYVTFYSHPDNNATINLYETSDGSGAVIKALGVGELYGFRSAHDVMSAKSVSGTQYLKFTMGGA